MRRTPSQAQLEDIVGGKILGVDGFYTAILEGQLEKCVVFRADNEQSARNETANWLWLQARLRIGDGFAEPAKGDPLRGTVVIVAGDDAFLNSLICER